MIPSPRHPHVRRFETWYELLLTILAALLALVAAIYAASLLLSGVLSTPVAERPAGSPYPDPLLDVYQTYPPAGIPLLAAALVLGGLLARRPVIAWAGAALLLAFSFLFIFDAGGAFLPLAGFLIALLVIRHILQTWRKERAG